MNKPFQVERRGERTKLKFKPKGWSHQDELRELKGKEIVLEFLDGSRSKSTLIDADPFTIKTTFRTVFKHALLGYHAV